MDLKDRYYMVMDLEATCCNDESFPTSEMETIEIGAVMVCGETLKPVSEFSTFIRPVRHPQLTEFCTKLTTIHQSDLDGAPTYKEAIAKFKAWMLQFDNFLLWGSWGQYDQNQIWQDCNYHNEPYPIPAPHLNLKKQFSKAQRGRKHQGVAGALRLAGIPLEGRHHRGLDDARNIARLLPFCFRRKFISQQN